ncbi:MAG TPA: hypothetical protein VGX03_27475 [Candidatus Binatia bacterium]|jgi:hypothetical protein|nr:hypothetical protein [Candidatus Binatia bacterium]
MNRKQYGLILVLSLIAGLMGSISPLVSSVAPLCLLRNRLGYTELEVPPDGTTEKRPVFSLVLSDPSGRIIWTAP